MEALSKRSFIRRLVEQVGRLRYEMGFHCLWPWISYFIALLKRRQTDLVATVSVLLILCSLFSLAYLPFGSQPRNTDLVCILKNECWHLLCVSLSDTHWDSESTAASSFTLTDVDCSFHLWLWTLLVRVFIMEEFIYCYRLETLPKISTIKSVASSCCNKVVLS